MAPTLKPIAPKVERPVVANGALQQPASPQFNTQQPQSIINPINATAADDLRGIKGFNAAFGEARKRGLQTFKWGSGVYGTELAKAKPAAATTARTAPAQPASKAPTRQAQSNKALPKRNYTFNNTNVEFENPSIRVNSGNRNPLAGLPPSPRVAPNNELPEVTATAPRLVGKGQPPYRPLKQSSYVGGFNNSGMFLNTPASYNNSPIPYDPTYETRDRNIAGGTFRPQYKKGGKLDNKEKEFIAYLIQESGSADHDELNKYIQELGQEGLKQEFSKFEELMVKGTEQIPAAERGAKLNYIKSLRGQCPDGFTMDYFEKGGVICSKCIKKEAAQKAPMKAKNGTKAVENFKQDKAKNSFFSDKKQNGGNISNKEYQKLPVSKKVDVDLQDQAKGTTGKAKTTPKIAPKKKVTIKKNFFGGKL